MTATTIAYTGIGVFILMSIGIILTMIEFTRLTEDPSVEKDQPEPEAETPPQAFNRDDIRIVRSNGNAA